jgi:putative hydrolase of the HAD superfamily
MNKLKVIAFDADDTLWVNEPYFQEVENKFCEMMEDYHPQHTISRSCSKLKLLIYRFTVTG